MKSCFLISIFCCSCLLISCIRKKPLNPTALNDQTIEETVSFAIIPLDSLDYQLFDSLHTSTELSKLELAKLDSLLKVFAEDSEGIFSKDKIGHRKIDLSKRTYKRQYVPAKDSSGQKKVWVNCLCSNSITDWRRNVIEVQDGGDCYFNVLINLSDETYSYFIVNGEA